MFYFFNERRFMNYKTENTKVLDSYFSGNISRESASAELYDINQGLIRNGKYHDIEGLDGYLYEIIYKSLPAYDPNKASYITFLWQRLRGRIQQVRNYNSKLVHVPLSRRDECSGTLVELFDEYECISITNDFEEWLNRKIKLDETKQTLSPLELLKLQIIKLLLEKNYDIQNIQKLLIIDNQTLREIADDIITEYNEQNIYDEMKSI